MTQGADKIEVENFTSPGRTTRVDRAKYTAMKDAYLGALPTTVPGLTAAEAKAALLPKLSQEHFPGGEKAGWWMKCVQLDLEAKGVVEREKGSPLRFHKV